MREALWRHPSSGPPCSRVAGRQRQSSPAVARFPDTSVCILSGKRGCRTPPSRGRGCGGVTGGVSPAAIRSHGGSGSLNTKNSFLPFISNSVWRTSYPQAASALLRAWTARLPIFAAPPPMDDSPPKPTERGEPRRGRTLCVAHLAARQNRAAQTAGMSWPGRPWLAGEDTTGR